MSFAAEEDEDEDEDGQEGQDDDDDDEDDDDDDDDDGLGRTAADGAHPDGPAGAKAAAKAAAKATNDELKAERYERAVEAFDAMEEEDQEAYMEAFFIVGEPIEEAIKGLVSKARSTNLNPFLKNCLRQEAPELVPFTRDAEADRMAYEASKKPFDASLQSNTQLKSFERMCPLFGVDGHFMPGFEDENPTHGFTKFVLKVAEVMQIEHEKITPNLIGFLAYTADKVATIVPRKKGWKSGEQVRASHRAPSLLASSAHCFPLPDPLPSVQARGDLDYYTSWAGGIARAKKFMQRAKRCQTKCAACSRRAHAPAQPNLLLDQCAAAPSRPCVRSRVLVCSRRCEAIMKLQKKARKAAKKAKAAKAAKAARAGRK